VCVLVVTLPGTNIPDKISMHFEDLDGKADIKSEVQSELSAVLRFFSATAAVPSQQQGPQMLPLVLHFVCRFFARVPIQELEVSQLGVPQSMKFIDNYCELEWVLWRLRVALQIGSIRVLSGPKTTSILAKALQDGVNGIAQSGVAADVMRECFSRVEHLGRVLAGPMLSTISSCIEATEKIRASLKMLYSCAEMLLDSGHSAGNLKLAGNLKSSVVFAPVQASCSRERRVAIEFAVEAVVIEQLCGRLQLISETNSHRLTWDSRQIHADQAAMYRHIFVSEKQIFSCAMEQAKSLVSNFQKKLESVQSKKLTDELSCFAPGLRLLRSLTCCLEQRATLQHSEFHRFVFADLTLFSEGVQDLRDRGCVDRFVQGKCGGSLLFSDPLCFLCHCLLGKQGRNAAVLQKGAASLACSDYEDLVLGQCLRAELLRAVDLQHAADPQDLEVLAFVWLGLVFGSEAADDEVSTSPICCCALIS
jgi:hypothetical protein